MRTPGRRGRTRVRQLLLVTRRPTLDEDVCFGFGPGILHLLAQV